MLDWQLLLIAAGYWGIGVLVLCWFNSIEPNAPRASFGGQLFLVAIWPVVLILLLAAYAWGYTMRVFRGRSRFDRGRN